MKTNDIKIQQDMRTLAGGIKHALDALYGPQKLPFEFMLILAVPENDHTVKLNTVTGITNPLEIMRIGQHIVDMGRGMMVNEPDQDVEGHA